MAYWANTVIPRKTADNVNRTVRNGNNNRAQCLAPENEKDTTSDENSGPVDRALTKLTMTGPGIEIDSLGVDYAKCDEIPVTKLIPVGVLDTDEHLVMRVSTITAEVSGLETSSYSDNTINETGTITVHNVRPPKMKKTLPAMIILVRSTGR